MIIRNKDIIQSYVLSTAKYDFSVYEKRILYRLVEMVQFSIEGQKLDKYYSIQPNLFGDMTGVTMPLSAFLKDVNDQNYNEVKKALTSLRNKTLEFENDHMWKLIGLIEIPKYVKKGYVQFQIHQEIYDAILNFSKGFRKYELKTAMSLDSVYSMRFYELLSGQKTPLIYTIAHLKMMFKVEHKYKLTADFIRKVVVTAKKELDKKSPYSFEYKALKEGRKIISIKFYPVFNSENRDPNLERNDLKRQTSLRWDLEQIIINYLTENFFFTELQIKNNIDLFVIAQSKVDLLYELSMIKPKAMDAENPQGYVIGVLKKLVKK